MLNPYIEAECAAFSLPPNPIETAVPETFSQCGEDLVVTSILAAIAPKSSTLQNLYYLDVGANHPIQTSNTYLMYKRLNGSGVLFEADPELIPALKRVRPRDEVVCTAVSARRDPTLTLHVAKARELSSLNPGHIETFSKLGAHAEIVKQVEVPNLHIDELLARYGQKGVQYLSIDTEGEDLAILQGIDFDRYRPWIMSCEPSGQFDRTNAQKIHDVMVRAGYTMAARTWINMVFVDKRWL